MPRLRVVAGPSTDALVPISANSDVPHTIKSDAFEGQILAYIKGFTDADGNVLHSEYFDRDDRKGITWSIQVQGRFLRPISADDVLFGNTFDRPLKLPWGSSAALKFMHFIDPTLEHDLTSNTKPWALSPLVATMPHLAHTRLPDASREPSPVRCRRPPHELRADAVDRKGWPAFPPPQSLTDDTAQLHLALQRPASSSSSPSPSPSPLLSRATSSAESSPDPGSSASASPNPNTLVLEEKEREKEKEKERKKKNRLSASSLASRLSVGGLSREDKLVRHANALQELRGASARRTYFRDAGHRRELVFGPEDVFTTDFCYGFIDFAPTLALHLPGGISFDLMHYWDGQPVRFVCCERRREADGSDSEEGGGGAADEPWGRVLWCVAIELVQDDEQQQQQPPAAANDHQAPGLEDDVD
ncbi:hypothetical protein BC834DRAFT_972556 [Gloeopeniophorella convolvens]|nr:hypothetical protein BC834DRAFT_972556 [Gloeopeniophorella convolvens]